LNGKSDEKGEGAGGHCSRPGAGCIDGGRAGEAAMAIRFAMSASAAAIEIAEGGGTSPAAALDREEREARTLAPRRGGATGPPTPPLPPARAPAAK
jgi:hypothetical protein